MLAHSSVPLSYFPFAFQIATFLINRLPTPVLHLKSPFEVLYNLIPNYHSIQVFGFACFSCTISYNAYKLQSRSIDCVLLGNSPRHKGYLCLDKHTGLIYASRHVIFNELTFPYKSSLSSSSSISRSDSSISVPVHISTALNLQSPYLSSIPSISTSLSPLASISSDSKHSSPYSTSKCPASVSGPSSPSQSTHYLLQYHLLLLYLPFNLW